MNRLNQVIFIADDDADDRYFMHKALQRIQPSLTFVETEDGYDLLTQLESWSQQPTPRPVHLILIDMNMPKVNGLETLTAIKANPALRHIPAVMISTSVEPAQVAAAYKHGISGYIQKPVTTAHMDQIARAINICFLTATGG